MSAARAGSMSRVWNAPLTGSSAALIAPALMAAACTWRMPSDHEREHLDKAC